MVSEGRQFLQIAPWLMFFPAAAISTAVIGANLLGDGIGTRLSYRGGRSDL
jgi:peptide/nickel transport system permease protein